MNPGILARRDVTYASMPWSTACCSVLCSPLSMIVQPDNAREEIGEPSLALRARTTLCFYVTIPYPWTDAGGVPGACGLCQPSNKGFFAQSDEAHIGFQGRRCEDGVNSPHPMSHPMTGVQRCRST